MKPIVAGLLLCISALIMALAMDDVAMIRAESERAITVLRCEAETLRQYFEERMLREQFKHAIELRNLDAAIQKQTFENMLRLMEEQEERTPSFKPQASNPKTQA